MQGACADRQRDPSAADTLGKDKPDFTAEEKVKWDKLNEDLNRMTDQIELVRRAGGVGTPLGSGEERRKAKPVYATPLHCLRHSL